MIEAFPLDFDKGSHLRIIAQQLDKLIQRDDSRCFETLAKTFGATGGDLLQLLICQIEQTGINTGDTIEPVVMGEHWNFICGEMNIGFNIVRPGGNG